jgi:ESS family glutamate:Na+ symporter
MRIVELTELQTLAIGLAALLLGTGLCKRVPGLGRLNIPGPVVGGVLVALVLALLRSATSVEVHFGTQLMDFLLLVFFTTIGLSAKLKALLAGGKPLALLCAVTVVLLFAQNLAGVLIALGYGAHPYYGLLIGSISFVGGPGTAAAWAKEAQAVGLEHAPEVAVAAATCAVIVGAVVSGPITGWLIEYRGLRSTHKAGPTAWIEEEPDEKPVAPAPSLEQSMFSFLLIAIAVLAGQTLNEWARAAGVVLPGFLTAMLVGVAITNLGDTLGFRLALEPIERDGEVALHAFLAMYLMSLKVWILGALIGPLALNVAAQVVLTTAVAVFVLFRLLGRDYDAAVAMGGFLGFGLSSMAAAMATMGAVTERYGPSAKAFLLITLAGSFFVDLANAFVVQALLALPLFR